MDFLTAAKLARDGKARELYRAVVDGVITVAQRDAVFMWEPHNREWRERRAMRSESALEELVRAAWGPNAFDGWAPKRTGHTEYAHGYLVEPGYFCARCERPLSGRQQTFCSPNCRTQYQRHGRKGVADRWCNDCRTRLGHDELGICDDCRMARMDAENARYEHECEADGCGNVAVWAETGRPPKYCSSTCRDREKKRRQRARKRAEQDRERAASDAEAEPGNLGRNVLRTSPEHGSGSEFCGRGEGRTPAPSPFSADPAHVHSGRVCEGNGRSPRGGMELTHFPA